MGYIDVDSTNTRHLQTVNLNLEATNERLRADLREANKEIDRLKQDLVELKHDLDFCIAECEKHHSEAL